MKSKAELVWSIISLSAWFSFLAAFWLAALTNYHGGSLITLLLSVVILIFALANKPREKE